MTGKAGLIALITGMAAAPAAAIIWPDVLKWPVAIGIDIALFIIGLAGGVAGELRKRWQTRLTDRLDKALGRKFTRFYKRYRQYVLSDLRVIDLKGLTTIGFYNPELDEVFVDVSLAYRAPHQVPAGLLGDLHRNTADRHSISEFLNDKKPVVLAVLGAPGSGKTTLLRHTARRMFDRKNRSVPILLYLRDHIAHIAKDHNVSLPDLVREAVGIHIEGEPSGWFDQKLKQGECVVLLDGLDEVAKQEDRRRVADWVELQIRRYPHNSFVLTSRPQGYQTAPVHGATVLQVRSFTDDQVQKFLHGWYVAVTRHTTKRTLDEAEQVAAGQTKDLLDRLAESPALIDLTANPLLLTMIANVHHYRGALPGSRADLYNEICQVMLWRRQEEKKLEAELDGSKKETLLRGLAFAMMQRKVRDLQENEVLTELNSTMRRVSRKVTAKDFLADVSSNGLLVEREPGQYSFAHLTFQEFLAASHIREKGLVRTLADNVEDIWWRETTLLYTAKSDADVIVKACLESGSGIALLLAFHCAEQDSELDPDLHAALDDAIEVVTPEADQERRDLAAELQLTRFLRKTVRVTARAQVCVSPVSNKIFHLFRQQIPSSLPDASALAPIDDNPVAGVRWSDASAFSRWASERTGRDYRLPTAEELESPAVQSAFDGTPPTAWTNRQYLWVSPNAGHPLLVDRGTQVRHIEDDFHRSSSTLVRLLAFQAVIASRQIEHEDAGKLTATLVETLSGERTVYPEMSFDVNHARSVVLRAATPPRFKDTALDQLIQAARLLRTTHVATELDNLLAIDAKSIHAAAAQVTNPVSAIRVAGKALAEATAPKFLNERSVTDSFIENTRIAATEVVDLDRIVSTLQKPPIHPPLDEWTSQVTERFSRAALPVFEMRQPLTPAKATALRLTALCLAVQRDMVAKEVLGNRYRMIAAGVTLLERRAARQSPVTETIILATG